VGRAVSIGNSTGAGVGFMSPLGEHIKVQRKVHVGRGRSVNQNVMLSRILIAAGLICGLSWAQDLRDGGPLTLVITYRCIPAMRTQLRQHMLSTGIARLQHWREEGDLKDYHVLFSRYVDTDSWDMMTILSFSNYSEIDKWKRVERAAPAGLDNATLALTVSVNTYPADLMMRNGSDVQPTEPVYLVTPYAVSAKPADYLNYMQNYIRPQFEGVMQEGILSRYEVYTQRYGAARPWDSLVVLEFKDDESLGLREKTMAAVRAKLMTDSNWRALSDQNQYPAEDQQSVIADDLVFAPVRR
jgi:hypothetical protein